MRNDILRRRLRDRAQRIVVGLAMLVVLGGCDLLTGPERVKLAVEVQSLTYAPGDTVRVTLRNDERSSWYYLAGCYSAVQRREGNAWVSIADYCGLSRSSALAVDWLTVAPLEVPAGGSYALWYVLPADAAPGPYRIAATFYSDPTYEGRNVNRASPTFEVLSFSLATR